MANFPDPYDMLLLYTAGYPSWSDATFDAKLNAATATIDPELRMKELAECETALLRDMPVIPLYYDTWVYLERPEVHGWPEPPRRSRVSNTRGSSDWRVQWTICVPTHPGETSFWRQRPAWRSSQRLRHCPQSFWPDRRRRRVQ